MRPMWYRAFLLAGLIAAVPLPAAASGAWVLTEVTTDKPPISESPCYPGKTIDLSDGSARFSQGYADCSGQRRVKGGERANTTIRWQFSQPVQLLQPDTPLVVRVSITRDSNPVPYHGGGAAYFYFRSQSAVGGVELKGFLDNPNFARSIDREIRLDRVPAGRDGDKLTMWMNVSGESGIGDVFYKYEFRQQAAAAPPSPPPAKDPADIRCGQYALAAKKQASENVARGCGYTGDRWQADYQPHFLWCEAAATTDEELARETGARTAALAQCRPTVTPPTPAPPPPAPPAARDSGARFSSLSGEIEVRHDGEKEWRFAKLGTVLRVGDHVRTSEDSTAIIGFADLSTFLMKPESEIVITTPPERDSMVRLVAGNILKNVRKMLKDGTMEVEMSQAIAGARGTIFAVGTSPGAGDTAAVLQGAIEVRSKATGRTILLNQGQRVAITARGFSPVESFDVDAELARWGERFPGAEMADIRQRVDESRARHAPSRDGPSRGPAADAGDGPYGYWAVSEGADGVKMGLIFPDYSTTEYVGALFFCVPQGGVRVSVDSPGRLVAGSKAKVTITADAATVDYRGTVQDKMTDDGSIVVFDTTFNDPIFEDLAQATTIGIGIDGRKVPLPMRNSRKTFKQFFERCHR